jgi:hypothetical protein
MMRAKTLALALGILASAAGSIPGFAAGKTSLSLRNSFRIGNSGVLCTAQSKAVGPNLVDMFDRGYSIVCRDAASAVGTLQALRKGKDDPLARIAKHRSADLKCEAPKPAKIDGLGSVSASDCIDQ